MLQTVMLFCVNGSLHVTEDCSTPPPHVVLLPRPDRAEQATWPNL